MIKFVHRLLGIIIAFCLMWILFVTSIEAVVYWNPGYFQKEYTKYNVLQSLPSMTMDSLLHVTDEMMAYLKGDREDLHVMTTMGGREREFFNEREIAHMEDVRGLFLGAIFLRNACAAAAAVCLVLLLAMKARLSRVLPACLCIGTGLFFGILAALALIISTDFSKYFIIFHHIFFHNDLWILDPATDMLINIVPEGFFFDTAARVAGLYGLLTAILFGISLAFVIRNRRKG